MPRSASFGVARCDPVFWSPRPAWRSLLFACFLFLPAKADETILARGETVFPSARQRLETIQCDASPQVGDRDGDSSMMTFLLIAIAVGLIVDIGVVLRALRQIRR